MDFVNFVLSFWLITLGAVAAGVTAWFAWRRSAPHALWRLAWGFLLAPWIVSVILGGLDALRAQALLVRSPFGVPVWLSVGVAIGLIAAKVAGRPR